jgi:hypothetical protein
MRRLRSLPVSTASARSLTFGAFVTGLGVMVTGCEVVTRPGDFNIQECANNQDCVSARGENFICRKSDRTCIGLLTAECQKVLGSVKDDDTVLMGGLFALTGANGSIGRGEANALELAFNDFRTSANGLPPLPGSARRRPMAVLVCDDAASNDVATRSVTHLAKEVEVPVIVGPTWSGVTIKMLGITVPAGVLMLATGTTSPDLTNLDKGGLFFRLVESMTVETKALSLLVADVEARVRQKQVTPAPVRLAVIFKGDSYGKGSTQALVQTLMLNESSVLDSTNRDSFTQLNYGNPADAVADPLRYSETAAALVAFSPDIIVPIGTNEIFGNIMSVVEQSWTKPSRPTWVYPHTGLVGALVDYLKASDPKGEIRRRVLGVTYGSRSATYEQFRVNYASQVTDGSSPDSLDASTTYDAFYVAAFAAAAAGSNPLTGRTFASGIRKLVPPAPVRVRLGPNDLNMGFSVLSQGGTIDIEGASGPLDFNLQTGDVLQEAQAWCVPSSPSGQPLFPIFSGYGFDLQLAPVGTFRNIETACGIQ